MRQTQISDNSIDITDIVGTYQKVSGYGFVRADLIRLGCDVYIPSGHDHGASSGDKVAVHIDAAGGTGRKPQGTVTEILGQTGEPGMDIRTVVRALGIVSAFPEDVLLCANQVNCPIPKEEIRRRLDLRDLITVTIDGDDSKDFDDAVSLTKENGFYHLGVHIADVSYYVQEDSPLDREAFRRGISLYLADSVIPMLPPVLSNGICSLNEGEDRLTVSCLMTIDAGGAVIDHSIVKTVIRSNRRMTYRTVNDIIFLRDEETINNYGKLSDLFFDMQELSAILRRSRGQRGAIDFDLPESKVVLGPDGSVQDILPYERNAATMLIEDFMLLANETVAEEYSHRQLSFLYRIHEKPSPEKMKELSSLLRQLGYPLKGDIYNIHPKEIQKLLENIAGSENEDIVSRLTLRSMQQARYATDNAGHFGLASRYYCHFTSPIRRYPDLMIQRIISECLEGRLDAERIAHYDGFLDDVARQSSSLERRAVDAERAVLKRKKAQYMANHIGEFFTGIISGVTSYGLYVELKNTCEGLIPLRSMEDDYYEYDGNHYLIYGVRHGREYRLGDSMTVTVTDVDCDQGYINLRPAGRHEKKSDIYRQTKAKTLNRINRKSSSKAKRKSYGRH